MRTVVIGVLALVITASAQKAAKANRDPDAARLITSDIPNFWRAFDKASSKDDGEVFEREYLEPGTAGLHDFVKNRIQNGGALAKKVAARHQYFTAIRESTLAVDGSPTIKEAIRASFRRLKEIYPNAVFPDVYFLIGRMNSAGTVSSNGLLIGVEMNARSENTPTDELSAWEKAVIGEIANLPHVVAHELIHIQQRMSGKESLLREALNEGGADFMGELISGGTINNVQRNYGDAHEKALWTQFQEDMMGKDFSGWLYQGDKSKDRPADLGYYMGYRICKAFYDRASDKAEAVRRILNIADAEGFLRESGYGM
jgi:hypothetical protein